MLWAARECGHAAFADARLSQRLVSLVATLSEHPASSLPTALGKWSDTKAAYRFLDNERVTPAAIYQGHRRATLERAKGHSVLLAVQDTTGGWSKRRCGFRNTGSGNFSTSHGILSGGIFP